MTNEQTNHRAQHVTNERGEYVFSNIDPGTYAVKAHPPGLQDDRPHAASAIGTQQFLTLDLTMEVGAIEENVTVTGQSPLIETANASQGTVLDSEALQTLPRPAARRSSSACRFRRSSVGDGQYNRQQDQTNASLLSLGGGTRRGNNYVLDGVPITDLTNRAVANPSIEALDDVKVQVHTYDAEMGRTGGGVFNTTLKSGTNNFRGTGFFQTRPLWGVANNYFGAQGRTPKPAPKYYLPGGGFGGPIVKNRTFFWFAGEGYRDVSTRGVTTIFATQAMRNGDFSG
jgi:hypothetical protein